MRRPLSPHLQIYRLPLTAWLSITHRITGVVLGFGLIGLVGFVLALAGDGTAYTAMQRGLQSPVGRLLLFLWLLALFLHFCHGIRHLLWDLVWGFERERLACHSVIELIAALGLTGLSWLWI